MEKKKVFIDGREGTTGLRIYERIASREDIEMIVLPEEKRKDTVCRREALNCCDIAFLCLPDAAAVEAVDMIENPNVKVLDTSTAHRTAAGWAYGFPELSQSHFDKIAAAKRTAVPGCHASGFIALIYPLIKNGILSPSSKLVCTSVTGYSGGGKKMIAQYESSERSELLGSPRQYALGQEHKHLKEMKAVTGAENYPVFCPIVADYYSGMSVTVPLFVSELSGGAAKRDIIEVYSRLYNTPVVSYTDCVDCDGLLAANALSGSDSMRISVAGNDERILLLARYDNLGKGASGAAVQCMNIMLGKDPVTGLDLK